MHDGTITKSERGRMDIQMEHQEQQPPQHNVTTQTF